ncbi:MAG: hypothetical protein HW421_4024 [Ignavibacteria bacterium]|nr:hypothetical protein [Ignavibacteria bacterium]
MVQLIESVCFYCSLTLPEQLNTTANIMANEIFEITWSFDAIEEWLAETDMPNEKKEFIKKVIDMFKQHVEN